MMAKIGGAVYGGRSAAAVQRRRRRLPFRPPGSDATSSRPRQGDKAKTGRSASGGHVHLRLGAANCRPGHRRSSARCLGSPHRSLPRCREGQHRPRCRRSRTARARAGRIVFFRAAPSTGRRHGSGSCDGGRDDRAPRRVSRDRACGRGHGTAPHRLMIGGQFGRRRQSRQFFGQQVQIITSSPAAPSAARARPLDSMPYRRLARTLPWILGEQECDQGGCLAPLSARGQRQNRRLDLPLGWRELYRAQVQYSREPG